MANFCERLLEENICKLERHTKTDEVFVLLEGNATLHIGLKFEKTPMEMGKLYNVKCGQWHAISMMPNTKVVIIENEDTDKSKTEYYYFKNKENKS